MVVQIKRNFQITIPSDIRKRIGVKIGDFFDAVIAHGKVILVPKKMVDAEQSWFWTKRWQEAEKEADADIKAGRVKRFKSAQDLIKDLDK